MDFTIYKNDSFKKVFIPSYFEIATALVVNITDILFVSMGDVSFVNVFAIIINFMVLSYISSQIGANIGASKAILQDNPPQAHMNCMLLVLGIGFLYTTVLYMATPFLAVQAKISNDFLLPAIIFGKILAFNAVLVAFRKGLSAILSIHKYAKYNLQVMIGIIIINIILNTIAYMYFLPGNIASYIYCIALSTLISQLCGIGFLCGICYRKKYLSLKYICFGIDSIKNILTMFKTTMIASFESMLFIALTYLFLVIMAYISLDLLTVRNIVAPWFLLVGSIGQAWGVYANRQISVAIKSDITDTHIKTLIYDIIKHSILFTVVGGVGLILMLLLLKGVLPIALFSMQNILICVICLLGIDIFRCMNMILLTIFRIQDKVKKAAYNAFITQTSTAILLFAIYYIWSLDVVSATLLGICVFTALVLEECTRTFLNMRYLNKIKIQNY